MFLGVLLFGHGLYGVEAATVYGNSHHAIQYIILVWSQYDGANI